MAIELHPQCVERLKGQLEEIFQRTTVDGRRFLGNSDARLSIFGLDKTLPQKGPVADALQKLLGDYPLSQFIVTRLIDDFEKAFPLMTNDKGELLTALPGFEDAKSAASHYIDEFCTLPWQYALSIPLSDELSDSIRGLGDEVTLSKKCRIIFVNDDVKKTFPAPSARNMLLDPFNSYSGWSDRKAYLQVLWDGHYDWYRPLNAEASAMQLCRSVAGLVMAHRGWRLDYRSGVYPSTDYLIHKRIGDQWIYVGNRVVDDGVTSAISHLVAHNLDADLTQDQLLLWMRSRLQILSNVLEKGSQANSILLACGWFFDGMSRKDELLSFVQTTVVAEILLANDKEMSDKVGLTELLATRCSYLIARNQEERKDIYDSFREIYTVRSKIVHRGHPYLSDIERGHLAALRSLCTRIINKECELLLA